MPTSLLSVLPTVVLAGLTACAGSATPPPQADAPAKEGEPTPATAVADSAPAASTASSKATTFAEDFDWHGAASGVHVTNVNGDIEVEHTTGSEVEVAAKRSGPDAEKVRVEMDKRGKEVFFRVVYPQSRRTKTVRTGRRTVVTNTNVDARVDFVLKVPAGTGIEATTVNGQLTAHVAASDLELEAVNGRIEASGSGDVRASTVNGTVSVAVPKAHASRVELNSVSGALRVELPESVGATFAAQTLSGGIHSDYALDRAREMVGSRARGTHGDGKVDIDLETVSGAIRIEKS